ncbi:ATP-binding protein [Streptomyces minutiscleroticus]|uniref:Histidine kinase/HSP90-like ATPase domain-containing protein n=1 Tax=Streptomyces minutiscleroticus TaxID=68238 RepID=A0A918KTN0_9ACTN|nr:ATP-binding protein [Streptomyces minutiscleroticus]GGX75898.1 hypothetical protein GCM10010358_32820 [Streptomyces minutiscleroticus]
MRTAHEDASHDMRSGGGQAVEEVPHSAAAARRNVEDLLRSAGRDERAALARAAADRPSAAGGDRAVADALLVTSELVTNAIRHGGGVTDFEAELTDDGVRVAVGDRSEDLPTLERQTDDQGLLRVGCHGWYIVNRLARSVSISRLPGRGKRISVLLPLT